MVAWRSSGQESARTQLATEYRHGFDGLLLSELHMRLNGDPTPRLLVDGIWFSQFKSGGISRVWRQIFNLFSLPGMFTDNFPLFLINRSSNIIIDFPSVICSADSVDPINSRDVISCSVENKLIAERFKADVFCSTWLSTTGPTLPTCPELALVHDCMPESYFSLDPFLMPLRHRWISGAASFLTVSSNTSFNLHSHYPLNSPSSWCHLAPDPLFFSDFYSSECLTIYKNILNEIGIRTPFLIIPGSGSLGSYKNPDVVVKALSHVTLRPYSLLITGINCGHICESILLDYPELDGRIFSAGFTDFELGIAFRFAHAVISPSLIEGFGLPVIEVMAAGGVPLISDVPGLREAGSEAAIRFDPHNPSDLISILQSLLIPEYRFWLLKKLAPRISSRLSRLNKDLFGLALLCNLRNIYKNS